METSNRNARTDTAESHVPLIIAASVSTLGGLLFGYDNIVISGAIGFLSQLFRLDACGIGWAAGCALVGCIVGCVAAGPIADYLGKKRASRCAPSVSVSPLWACSLLQISTSLFFGG